MNSIWKSTEYQNEISAAMIGRLSSSNTNCQLSMFFSFSVISSLGKEVRFPYLDEQLVDYLKSVPVWHRADLRLPRGVGEKYLLRYVACHYLSLEKSSKYPKRAIQFGSRIAKLENRKEKASDQCSRLSTKEKNDFDDDD